MTLFEKCMIDEKDYEIDNYAITLVDFNDFICSLSEYYQYVDLTEEAIFDSILVEIEDKIEGQGSIQQYVNHYLYIVVKVHGYAHDWEVIVDIKVNNDEVIVKYKGCE